MGRIIDDDSAKHYMEGVVRTTQKFIIEDELDEYQSFCVKLESAVRCILCY